MQVVNFPGVTLNVQGYTLNGAIVNLGSFTIEDPKERTKAISNCLAMIEQARNSEQMVTFSNLCFDPSVFDYFVVA